MRDPISFEYHPPAEIPGVDNEIGSMALMPDDTQPPTCWNPPRLTQDLARYAYCEVSKGALMGKVGADVGMSGATLSMWYGQGRRNLALADEPQLGVIMFEAQAIAQGRKLPESVFAGEPDARLIKDRNGNPVCRVAVYAVLVVWAREIYRDYLLSNLEQMALGHKDGNERALVRLLSYKFSDMREKPLVDQGQAKRQTHLATLRMQKEVELLQARIDKLTQTEDNDDLAQMRDILARAHAESPYTSENLAQLDEAGMLLLVPRD
jgi:hypothetical protein